MGHGNDLVSGDTGTCLGGQRGRIDDGYQKAGGIAGVFGEPGRIEQAVAIHHVDQSGDEGDVGARP